MIETLVALMLTLAPRAPEARIRPIAAAIAQVSSTREQASELVVLSFIETGFGREGPPFGIIRRGAHRMPLPEAAALARDILARGRAQCGAAIEGRHAYYRTGRCAVDDQARFRSRMVRRVIARYAHAARRAALAAAAPRAPR